jgi:hypothetical protein
MEVERRVVRGDEQGTRGIRTVFESIPGELGRVCDRSLSVEDGCVLRERPNPASDGDGRDGDRDRRQEKPGGGQVSPCSSLREDQYTMPPMTMRDKTVTARSTTATATASGCESPKPSVRT